MPCLVARPSRSRSALRGCFRGMHTWNPYLPILVLFLVSAHTSRVSSYCIRRDLYVCYAARISYKQLYPTVLYLPYLSTPLYTLHSPVGTVLQR